ncbi:MAG: Ku protein, partial [Myxococcota bacterium]|nr:Ku protein [Myxococcota bacterium]
EKDHGRLKQQYVCSVCGEVVGRDDTVRGYEYARGQYVMMSEDELKALETKSDRSIEIEEFVPIDQVDPLYFERAQLLGPDKGGQKAYRLLNEAMLETGQVAVGRFSTRGRQQLVLIRPVQRGLVLHGLYYADEVRSFDDIEFGDEVTLKKNEVDLATQLIEQLQSDRFEPKKYEDLYRQRVLEAVDRKVAGEEVVAAPAPEAPEPIIDLVAALKKSLSEEKGEGKKPAARKAGARDRKPARAKGKTSGGGGGARKAGSSSRSSGKGGKRSSG